MTAPVAPKCGTNMVDHDDDQGELVASVSDLEKLRLYFPQVGAADYDSAPSAAEAQRSLETNPPEWLKHLNWLSNQCGDASFIEGLTWEGAEDALEEMRPDEELTGRITDVWDAVVALGVDHGRSESMVCLVAKHLNLRMVGDECYLLPVGTGIDIDDARSRPGVEHDRLCHTATATKWGLH